MYRGLRRGLGFSRGLGPLPLLVSAFVRLLIGGLFLHASIMTQAAVRFHCVFVSKQMLTKKTVGNRITLPKEVAARFTGVEYFDVSTDGKRIVLRPLRRSRADEVRAQLAKLGIEQADVRAAVAWARKRT